MVKLCFVPDCSAQVISSCKCSGTNIYCCEEHVGRHLLKSGKHKFVALAPLLSDSERVKTLENLKIALEKHITLENEILARTAALINSIIQVSNDSLKKLRESESLIRNLFSDILLQKNLNKSVLKKVKKFVESNKRLDDTSYDRLKKHVKNLFTISSSGLGPRSYDLSSESSERSSSSSSSLRSSSDLICLDKATLKLIESSEGLKVSSQKYPNF